jgi:aminoglycoside/choline kinase family phosphotransferase
VLPPEVPEEITPEFLTYALRDLNGVIAESCKVTRIGEGTGFTGQIIRVEVQYKAHSAHIPRSLIAKLPTDDCDFRKKIWHVYEKEFQFYEEIAGDIEVRVPTCYFCARDIETHRGILLLEDFGYARAGDQVAGCSKEDAELGVSALASLHGSRWLGVICQPQEDDSSRRRNERRRELFPTWWTSFVEQYGDDLPELAIAIGEAIVGETETVEKRLSLAPTTFVHGDFRLDNLFFMEDGTVGVVDWQKHGNGRGIWDVGRFLVSSLDPELPAKTTVDLLERYHAALRSRGVLDYPFDLILQDFRASLLQMWLFVIRIAVLLNLSNERAQALMNREIAQIGQALVKHDAQEIVSELRLSLAK